MRQRRKTYYCAEMSLSNDILKGKELKIHSLELIQ